MGSALAKDPLIAVCIRVVEEATKQKREGASYGSPPPQGDPQRIGSLAFPIPFREPIFCFRVPIVRI